MNACFQAEYRFQERPEIVHGIKKKNTFKCYRLTHQPTRRRRAPSGESDFTPGLASFDLLSPAVGQNLGPWP